VSERQGPTGIEAMVCADIAERQRKGIAKYGTTVERNPLELRAWLTHLYQELTDAAIYARRAIREQEVRPRSAKMIGHKLMILREESGLTQAEFASQCGFSVGTLRELETGATLGYMKTWLAIVRATGCSLDWLISDREVE
jgi:DNA-binding transcriptional regulator YiaG